MEETSRTEGQAFSLLILPNPPADVSLTTFRAAYQTALTQALSEAASKSKSGYTSILDIALVCHFPSQSVDGPGCRSGIYFDAQRAIALLYGLVCFICTNKAIDLQYDNDVDVRVVLLNESAPGYTLGLNNTIDLQGPIIDMETLGRTSRPWSHVYSFESEEGEALLQSFISIRSRDVPIYEQPSSFTTERIAGGMITERSANQHLDFKGVSSTGCYHYHVAVGGTFDHLHAGHKLLLTATALILEPVGNRKDSPQRSLTIGITGDALLKNKKYPQVLETWDERQQAVWGFLAAIINFGRPQEAVYQSERFSNAGPNGKAIHHKLANGLTIKCVEISDPYGPTVTDEAITALVVSGETRSGGEAVNEKRRERGWSELEVFEVDVLDAGSPDKTASPHGFQDKISSTEIRKRLQARVSNIA
ncbi:hypothetical protein MMC26_006805 [Xylographa opegraphella]|nr:hypothetical protein [Xylographa opegraphella]